MKFLMVSQFGCGAHMLHMIQQEGNEVQLYVAKPGFGSTFDGILPKAKKIDPGKNTIVIFDSSGMGAIADKLKKSGILVVGASKYTDRLEQDRKFGIEVMEEVGIKVPMSVEFMGPEEVAAFLEENDEDDEGCLRRFVFKPSGKEDMPSHLTYCACDSEDLLEFVAYAYKNYGKEIESFVLQEFVEGAEVSTEFYSDGTKFASPAIHTVEAKAFMDGDHGPAVGCSGNLLWAEESMCRIASRGVAKVEKLIVESGYVGSVDLNAIVNDEGVWGLEWTPRFGFDSTPTMMHMMTGEIGKFMSDLAHGQLQRVEIGSRYGAGVRISIPPFPLDPPNTLDVQKVRPNIGVPIRGLSDKNSGSFYFYEVMDDDGMLVHCEGIGIIGVAVGVSDDPRHAFHKAYCALDEIKVPEKQYRCDLAEKLCHMHWKAEHQDNTSVGYLEAAVAVEG